MKQKSAAVWLREETPRGSRLPSSEGASHLGGTPPSPTEAVIRGEGGPNQGFKGQAAHCRRGFN